MTTRSNKERDRLGHERYMDEVAPRIWLGEKRAAFDDARATLAKHNIRHVVSIGYYDEWWKFRSEPKHLVLQIEDSPFVFICDHFGRAFRFMDEALLGFSTQNVGGAAAVDNDDHNTNNADNENENGQSSSQSDAVSSRGSVLVHCDQGRSRSGALVIAYLMHKFRQSYPETLNKVLIHRKRVMPNIGFQIQLRTFGKQHWKLNVKYSDIIDIEKELSTALKNLAQQVSRLQLEVRQSEKIFVTVDRKSVDDSEYNPGQVADVYVSGNSNSNSNGNNKNVKKNNNKKKGKQKKGSINVQRLVRIGLSNDDLSQFKKEWVLLVFLCHQFQLYRIGVHRSIITILQILGEMYFEDLVQTFIEVFEPLQDANNSNKSYVMEYDNPIQSIRLARVAYKQEYQKNKN